MVTQTNRTRHHIHGGALSGARTTGTQRGKVDIIPIIESRGPKRNKRGAEDARKIARGALLVTIAKRRAEFWSWILSVFCIPRCIRDEYR
jgi:hypothetical protein